MWKGLKSFFGFSGVADTALKIVDKIAGTDWTPKEKSEHILKFMEATKHQSPARRMIAMAIMVEQFTLVMFWLGYNHFGDPRAEAVRIFLEGNIQLSLNVIITFYFVSVMMKK